MRRREFALLLAGAMLAPRAGGAQQRQLPLVGFLHGSVPIAQYKAYVASFLGGLKAEGFEPERNLAVEYRWAEGHYERIPALAAELLALNPAVMVVYGPPGVVRAGVDAVPKTMPVVFGTGGDPVAARIVTNLARPRGSVTGLANNTNALDTKRLELLRDLLPGIGVFGMILNPKNSDAAEVIRGAQDGARSLGRELVVAGASTPEQLDEAFSSVVKAGAGALLMGSDT